MSSIMQTPFWGDLKVQHGWRRYEVLGFHVLERSLGFGQTFLYIPEIVANENELATVAARAAGALSHCKKPTTVFGRAEFLLPVTQSAKDNLKQAGFIKAKDEVQPEHRQVIELSTTLDEIKAQMKQKGRYNVGLASKHGVEVTEDNSDASIDAFAELINQTSSRHGFKGRSNSYLKALIATLKAEGAGGLWVAKLNGQILAGAVVSFWGDRASYLYGASSDQNRQVMAPYLLHYSLIIEAKRRGCAVYDLIGVAPEDASKNHSWAGISRFKREFGGTTIQYLGSYDRVYKPLIYSGYKVFRKKSG